MKINVSSCDRLLGCTYFIGREFEAEVKKPLGWSKSKLHLSVSTASAHALLKFQYSILLPFFLWSASGYLCLLYNPMELASRDSTIVQCTMTSEL